MKLKCKVVGCNTSLRPSTKNDSPIDVRTKAVSLAVIPTDPANKEFWKTGSPTGQLQVQGLNPDAFPWIEGDEIEITLTPVMNQAGDKVENKAVTDPKA